MYGIPDIAKYSAINYNYFLNGIIENCINLHEKIFVFLF